MTTVHEKSLSITLSQQAQAENAMYRSGEACYTLATILTNEILVRYFLKPGASVHMCSTPLALPNPKEWLTHKNNTVICLIFTLDEIWDRQQVQIFPSTNECTILLDQMVFFIMGMHKHTHFFLLLYCVQKVMNDDQPPKWNSQKNTSIKVWRFFTTVLHN